MTILAIDTATGPCSVAVWREGRIAAYAENLKPAAQSACLFPMIEAILAQSRLTYTDLSAIACTIGPGSFTGIRVALAAARGIALAAGIPGLGYTTLDVLAFAAPAPLLATLNAGKGECYYHFYPSQSPWQPACNASVGSIEQAQASATPPYRMAGHLTEPPAFPCADALAELAATHPEAARPLSPFYIRPPDAKLPGGLTPVL